MADLTRDAVQIIDACMTAEQREAVEAVDALLAAGWRFRPWQNGYDKGWWILPDSSDPVLSMRRGDPKNFHRAAVTTVALYL
jgi:hypothetical protein